ncbi:MAG: Maf family protein [Acidaminococcales bacterium]|jgi:septum formation protein|nr:Maf family protein [Acidaminococcales bacterium]
MKIFLASASPRRKALLEQIGLDFAVSESDFAEFPPGAFAPEELVRKNAAGKAAGAKLGKGAPVLAADTVVTLDGAVLGKPGGKREAAAMLKMISGRRHRVLTGVCLCVQERAWEFVETTDVYMRELADEEIDAYAATGEPLDKAGAYAIQGMGALFVTRVEGCYFNVVGLPLAGLFNLLKEAGIAFEYKKTAAR